jgi:phosphatidylglycerol---prolipoprotein diacylglyceryl transferase
LSLPFIRQPSVSLGPITIHAFGVLVAAAMLVGMRLVRKRAVAQGLDGGTADRLVTWILLGGFAGAHLVDRLVYFPGETFAEPIRLLRFWEGLSSFGGFLGAVVAAWIFFRHRPPERWAYLDAVAYAFPFGWILGRLGCFLAFDHPGLPTGFFLGEDDGTGVVRHNLGLEEALYTVLIAAVFYVLGRKRRPPGFFVGMLAVLYAPVRFLFDFLRTRDVHYLGLTPGQWGALALLGVGVALVISAQKKREAEASPLKPGS